MIKFELDEKQTSDAEKWMEERLKDGAETGAIGGRFTYHFTPTGLGVIARLVDNITNDSIDLTDYDSW